MHGRALAARLTGADTAGETPAPAGSAGEGPGDDGHVDDARVCLHPPTNPLTNANLNHQRNLMLPHSPVTIHPPKSICADDRCESMRVCNPAGLTTSLPMIETRIGWFCSLLRSLRTIESQITGTTTSLPENLADRLGVQVLGAFGGGAARAQRRSASISVDRPAHKAWSGAWLTEDDFDDDYDQFDDDDVMWTHDFRDDDSGEGNNSDTTLLSRHASGRHRKPQSWRHTKSVQTTLSVCAALVSGTHVMPISFTSF